jgi:hypothetical protein
MSKTTIGNCVVCGKPFDKQDTIWILREKPHHQKCITSNKILLELWKSTDWRQKELL